MVNNMNNDTNFNLTISQNDGDTSKTTTVTSSTPDELLRILQLAGNEDAMGHDHSEGGSCSVCGGGAMEAMEEDIQVENDPRSEPQVMSAGDNVVAHRKKQPATRHQHKDYHLIHVLYAVWLVASFYEQQHYRLHS
jgi:hypothetical protein